MRREEFSTQEVPNEPGVYVFRNSSGKVIYVGKAKSLRKRLASYFQPSRLRSADPKLRSLIKSIAQYELHPVKSESEALLLESRLIKQYSPRYNVALRDDKRFLLIAIDVAEPFPRPVLTRIKREDGRLYFGPFPRAGAARQTVRFLSAFFGLRACSPRIPDEQTRMHCADRIVRRCSRPCTGDVSADEYRRRVDRLVAALGGELAEVEDALQRDMKQLSDRRKFEEAARVRDILENVRYVAEVEKRRSFERATLRPHRDAAGSGVESLGKALGIRRAPYVIECFDISNIGGRMAVGSMVCFREGRPSTRDYRRFRIRTVEGSDDFGMMREVISRRYSRLLSEGQALPDLIVVDGGAGQLSAALSALNDIGCPPLPVLGLAKRQEEIYLPGRSEPVMLDRHEAALKLLQSARDEAHRFAVSYHRELRRKRIANSVLDGIDGVGEKRREQLLREFGGVSRLRKATAEEIAARVPGLGQALASKILESLNVNDGPDDRGHGVEST